jgi:hypothetical protein
MDACKQLLLSWTDLLFHILEQRHRGVPNISARIKSPHWLSFSGPDSSVGIANRYGLESPLTEFRWGAEIFHAVQSDREAHPASCAMSTESFQA